MMPYLRLIILGLVFFVSTVSVHTAAGYEKKFKVLVVMSYEESYPWGAEIREGIESILGNSCTIKYGYLNTKTNRAAEFKKV